jgi:hypothetical protein
VSHREIYVDRPRQETDPRQQGHMEQSENDKCQAESAFQVRANQKS